MEMPPSTSSFPSLPPKVAEVMSTACIFKTQARPHLDDGERQRQMRREKHEGMPLRDAPPPLLATQRGLHYGNAMRCLFYALSGARRSNDLERITILTHGGLEVEILKRETLLRWDDRIVANCASGLFGSSATELCRFVGFESGCPHLDYDTFASTLTGAFVRAGINEDMQLLLLRDASAYFIHHRAAFEATTI